MHALVFAILLRGVGARHAKRNTFSKEESARGSVVELTAIVTLYGLHGATELSKHICKEVSKGTKSVRLQLERKSLKIMRAIINNN